MFIRGILPKRLVQAKEVNNPTSITDMMGLNPTEKASDNIFVIKPNAEETRDENPEKNTPDKALFSARIKPSEITAVMHTITLCGNGW